MDGGSLVLVGSSHRTAPLERLESLAVPADGVAALLPDLTREAGLEDAVLLSTCNRTEVYGTASDPDAAVAGIERWLAGRSGAEVGIGPENVYVRRDEDAVEHLFRVICGLDSMMLGETEIAGQVQRAFELAQEAGTAGPAMADLLSSACRASKRARTETAIDAGTTSVASAAVHLACRVFGDLGRREIAVVGAGETGSLVAGYFAQRSPGALHIVNRTASRAEDLARKVGGRAVAMEGWLSLLGSVDAVVLATHADEPLLTEEAVRGASGARSSRTLLVVDISLPRNAEPRISEIDCVYLCDMSDLGKMVERSLERRAREVPAVEAIIDEEAGCYFLRRATMQVGPVIREIRESFEDLRRREVERFGTKISEEDRPVVDRLTRDLVNKLLHWPTVEIRALARGSGTEADRLDWARRLFGLDRAGGKGGGE